MVEPIVHGPDDPEYGHRFTIWVTMLGASSIRESDDVEPHHFRDSDWQSTCVPQVVRAESLRAALVKALDIPFSNWLEDAEHYDVDRVTKRTEAYQMGKTMPSTVGSDWWFRYAEQRAIRDGWPDEVVECLLALARGVRDQEAEDLAALRRI